jgi:hypothetical protein
MILIFNIITYFIYKIDNIIKSFTKKIYIDIFLIKNKNFNSKELLFYTLYKNIFYKKPLLELNYNTILYNDYFIYFYDLIFFFSKYFTIKIFLLNNLLNEKNIGYFLNLSNDIEIKSINFNKINIYKKITFNKFENINYYNLLKILTQHLTKDSFLFFIHNEKNFFDGIQFFIDNYKLNEYTLWELSTYGSFGIEVFNNYNNLLDENK